ncbi:MAG: glycosyl hydrolase 115 family protein [Melioribacteraceae bacterium]|nr:glycosyl hydrolase 115 family protein [Melioribacteraceae bacterium]
MKRIIKIISGLREIRKSVAALIPVIFINTIISAGTGDSYISRTTGSFTMSSGVNSAAIFISPDDYPGVIRVAKLLQTDIEKVTGIRPELRTNDKPEGKEVIIAGTIGKSLLLDELIRTNKINVDDIRGKWEASVLQVVDKPFDGVEKAFVIAGSDKRGTIFGIFDLSEKIGVSPWYWWADVPVKKSDKLFVKSGRYTYGEPKVKYRGIFINDEAPALSGWSQAKYGTVQFNHHLYENVFELILRLKGNFLWPAMWGRAFYDDDPINPQLADEYGIVIGTSHHEPMMRAHVEWQRYGSGPWNYEKNEVTLKDFWKKGIERMGSYESIVTLAMRGDGDEAMSSTANVELLQRIVNDQREILTEVTGKEITEIPQVWALYKEVQEYYDKGMRVPDDVTLLLCDDNWGNIRKLPNLNEKPRSGGYGMYYHYDYVGGPRNYKWLNTNQIERVWQQMTLAYEYGVKEIWIVNVGDIKPMEFPIDFFLDLAWDPEKISAEDLPAYYKHWAEEQFGSDYIDDVAEILSKYTKFNSRRKPELLAPDTYSLIHYQEAEQIVNDYKELEEKALSVYDEIPQSYRDAFYQLVLHPVEACANLNEMLVTIGKNRLYAKQGRALTNKLADKAEELFERDAEITFYYNEVMADGKWKHMMDQTHIGYTSWQQPDENVMPEVRRINISGSAEMGVAIQGTETWFPEDKRKFILPVFDSFNKQNYYIDIFNRGEEPFEYSIKSDSDWIVLTKPFSEIITTEQRIQVSIDWDKAPKGMNISNIKISGPANETVIVDVVINNQEINEADFTNRFIESNGYISIEAENYSDAINSDGTSWAVIPNLGKTASAVTLTPYTEVNQVPGDGGSCLKYDLYLFSSGEVKVNMYFSPTLNYGYSDGLYYGVSFNDKKPKVINITEGDTPDWKYPQYWNQQVSNNIRIKSTKHVISKPGKHVLKFWAVNPGVVLQKIVIDFGGVKESYLGPPESFNSMIIN